MKQLKNKQKFIFDKNIQFDILTIGAPLPVYKILLYITIEKPVNENVVIVFSFMPSEIGTPIVTNCNLSKNSNGGYFMVGKPDKILEDVIGIIQVEANVYNSIEFEINVFEVDKEERGKH